MIPGSTLWFFNAAVHFSQISLTPHLSPWIADLSPSCHLWILLQANYIHGIVKLKWLLEDLAQPLHLKDLGQHWCLRTSAQKLSWPVYHLLNSTLTLIPLRKFYRCRFFYNWETVTVIVDHSLWIIWPLLIPSSVNLGNGKPSSFLGGTIVKCWTHCMLLRWLLLINQVPGVSDFPGDYTTLNWKSCDLTHVHVSWSGTVLPRNGDGMGAYFKLNAMILCFRKEKKKVPCLFWPKKNMDSKSKYSLFK